MLPPLTFLNAVCILSVASIPGFHTTCQSSRAREANAIQARRRMAAYAFLRIHHGVEAGEQVADVDANTGSAAVEFYILAVLQGT